MENRDADEFIRHFLLALPKGLRRIRHFGFLANACRATMLAAIRAALQASQQSPTTKHDDYRERYAVLTGHCIETPPHIANFFIWRCSARPSNWPSSSRSPRPGYRLLSDVFEQHCEIICGRSGASLCRSIRLNLAACWLNRCITTRAEVNIIGNILTGY